MPAEQNNLRCNHLLQKNLEGQNWSMADPGLDVVQAAAENADRIQALLSKEGTTRPDAPTLQVRDSVGIVQITGPIFRYDNILSQIFGFPSVDSIMADLHRAAEDPEVKSIVLQLDSPGGQVGGINELTKHIKELDKKTVAYVGGTATSAAYWIASATDEIVADETAFLGSIGVVFTARKKSEDMIEIVSTSSAKKRPNPETNEGRKQLLEQVDAVAEVFIQAVASNRSLTRQKVVELQGDIVIAHRAIKAGLADRTGSLEGLIAELNSGEIPMQKQHTTPSHPSGAAATTGPKKGKGFEELVADYQAKHEVSKGEAISAIARLNPEAHQAYIQAQNSPQSQESRPHAEKHEFWQQAKALSQKENISLSAAIKETANNNPSLHERFVREMGAN